MWQAWWCAKSSHPCEVMRESPEDAGAWRPEVRVDVGEVAPERRVFASDDMSFSGEDGDWVNGREGAGTGEDDGEKD